MDPIVSLVYGLGTAGIAAVVAIVVGRRRGLDQVEDRADGETRKLVEAQAARLVLLEADNARLAGEVRTLTAKVAALENDLLMERRITFRMRQEQEQAK